MLLTVLISTWAVPSVADDIDELRKLRDTTINLVHALVEQGVLSREKADALIAQAQQAAAKAPEASAAAPAAPTAVAPGVVRVPYVPESVKEAIGAEVKEEVLAQAKKERWGEPGAFPDWIHNVNVSGDVRFRAEGDRFPRDNAPNASVAELNFFGVNIANSTEADNRLRFRARLGFDANVGDSVAVDLRLVSGGVGAGSNPGSENQTLGNYEVRSAVGFDRAYVAYRPISWLTVSGGRLGTPFFKPTTLIWADDVSLEGLVVRIDPKINSMWSIFGTAGLFPVLQNDPTPLSTSASKWLYAYQTGFDVRFDDRVDWRLAAALYDYRNIEGIPNPNIFSTQYSGTAAPYRQTGNTVFDINSLLNTQNGTQNYLYGLASKFHELNVSTSLNLGLIGTTHVVLDGDWVKNLGFDQNEIFHRTGFQVVPQVRGWQTRLTVGDTSMERKHAWQAWIGYRYVQRDSTVDAFTDQDFHLGGTDAQGYFLGARYAFEKNSNIALRWFSAKQIDGVELAGADSALSGLPLAIDVLQIDVISSF